jgi:hypothetical protein
MQKLILVASFKVYKNTVYQEDIVTEQNGRQFELI